MFIKGQKLSISTANVISVISLSLTKSSSEKTYTIDNILTIKHKIEINKFILSKTIKTTLLTINYM